MLIYYQSGLMPGDMREKYVAVIPFLRQIAITLENHLIENKKAGMSKNVKRVLSKHSWNKPK